MNQHTPFDYTHFVDLSEEAKRLVRQGQFFYRFTRRLFETAGITTGMRVLDVGSGAGDVALLAAELVGPQGTVVGVDMNAGPLQIARERAQAAGLSNVSFLVDVARALLPLMLKLGVSTAEEVDIETLESRLREEAVKQRGAAVGVGLTSAWVRKD